MSRPRRVRIGHTLWKVRWSRRAVAALHDGDPDAAVGITIETLRVMAISGDLVPDMERETFFHELLHACVSASGLSLPVKVEEALVSVLAPRLLGVLRQNPAVVAYLLELDD